jgi:hypothetical protein
MTYVAIVSGEVLYDGRLEPITAGVSYIADGHEIVRRFPHMFKQAPSTWPTRPRAGSAKRAVTTAPSAPARAALPTRRVVQVSLLRDRTPRFEVRLTADLVWSIEREISATLSTYGVVETGGYLVSHRPDYIGIQTGTGPKSTHAPSRFQLDDSAATRWLQSDPLLRIVGDWHLHPSWDGTPSDHDVRGWAGHCTRSMSHYLGIVATKGELGFMTPELHGWVAFWDGDTAVCEPAGLTGW